MKRLSAPLFGTALALLVASTAPSRADYFASWGFTDPNAPPSVSSVEGRSSIGVIPGGGFPVTLDKDGTQFHAAALFASDLNVLTSGQSDHFDASQSVDAAHRGVLNLRLTVFGQGGLTNFKDFQVSFGGTWGKDANGTIYSRLKAQTSPSTAPIFLSDGTEFQVQIYTTTPPTFQSQPVRGDIWGNITVTKGTSGGGGSGGGSGGGGPSQAPEPSTVLLSCVGLSCLSLGAWRRRRQGAAAAN
jgi:hypothetical protein